MKKFRNRAHAERYLDAQRRFVERCSIQGHTDPVERFRTLAAAAVAAYDAASHRGRGSIEIFCANWIWESWGNFGLASPEPGRLAGAEEYEDIIAGDEIYKSL